MTSSIVVPYKREHTIDDSATMNNGEAVFTHSSPRSSTPGTDRGTPAAIGSGSHGASDRASRARTHEPRLGTKGQSHRASTPAYLLIRRRTFKFPASYL